jgi:YfiR/HmsC-like
MSRKILTSLALGALLLQMSVSAATLRSKYETKAGYLLNFAEFIEWPAGAFSNARSPIILGVVGKDPFGPELDKLQGKTVNGRTLEIRRFKGALEFRGEETPGRRQDDLPAKQAKKLAEMKSCHILFITSSEKNFLPQTLKPFRGASVLTVGETDSFAREGGMITFVDSENNVQLEINLAAAEQARLKISSKLLSLAKVIKIESEAEKKK